MPTAKMRVSHSLLDILGGDVMSLPWPEDTKIEPVEVPAFFGWEEYF